MSAGCTVKLGDCRDPASAGHATYCHHTSRSRPHLLFAFMRDYAFFYVFAYFCYFSRSIKIQFALCSSIASP